jgi:hypothetical protein
MQKMILFIMGLVCVGIIDTQAEPIPHNNITGTVVSAKDDTPLAGASIFLQKSETMP